MARNEFQKIFETCSAVSNGQITLDTPEKEAAFAELAQARDRYDRANEAYEAAKGEVMRAIDFEHPGNSLDELNALHTYS